MAPPSAEERVGGGGDQGHLLGLDAGVQLRRTPLRETNHPWPLLKQGGEWLPSEVNMPRFLV
jgi:hypothetical protein